MTKRPALDDLPLFADEASVGQAVLGIRRAAEWPSLVPLYEREGFPKVDPIAGGRYVPAIKAFFDRQYGLSQVIPTARNGIERPEKWNAPRRRA